MRLLKSAFAVLLSLAVATPPALAAVPTQPITVDEPMGRCRIVDPLAPENYGVRRFGMGMTPRAAYSERLPSALSVSPPSPAPPASAAPPPPPPPPPAMPAPPQASVAPSEMARSVPYYAPRSIISPPPVNTERYDERAVNTVTRVADQPVSTFSIDVDTGSYANVRRFLREGQIPPEGAVRVEEMLNYFPYSYPAPRTRDVPFALSTEMARTPWNPKTHLLRIGLRAWDVSAGDRPPANLVFLVDVSGSMDAPDKLPLVRRTLSIMADQVRPNDKVSIVVYAGTVGVVLEPTNSPDRICDALRQLNAYGSTAGGEGLALAYQVARRNLIKGGVNRILLATDGDFNVGVTDNTQLLDMIERERRSGVTLTTLGFGAGNYNEVLMEQAADKGNGNYAYIDSAREAEKVLREQLSATLVTVAKDVKLQVEFNPARVSEYRLIGYENRALNEADFANDAIDAGEIGAGHRVTALYEVALVGEGGERMEDRRYPANRAPVPPPARADELGYLKLRYKAPDGDTSREIVEPLPASLVRAGAPAGDFALAAAVAAYGQKLRRGEYLNGYGWDSVAALARSAGNGAYRAEFASLVEQAAALEGADGRR